MTRITRWGGNQARSTTLALGASRRRPFGSSNLPRPILVDRGAAGQHGVGKTPMRGSPHPYPNERLSFGYKAKFLIE
jgi:hypothetical protein